jgi:hypothetical protein
VLFTFSLTVSTALIFINVHTTSLWILQINLIMTNDLNVLDTTPVSMLYFAAVNAWQAAVSSSVGAVLELPARSWAQALRSLRVMELPKPSLAVDNIKSSSSSLVSATCQAIQKNISGSILERGGAR